METVSLNASRRDRIGSRYARRYRSAGRLPAIVYGHREQPTPIVVDEKETITHLSHGVKLFMLDIDGSTETCLLKDLQFDHLGTTVVHLDFARVDLNEEVTVQATLRFVGDAAGLKQPGAIFRLVEDTLEVRCIATAIPEHLDVDISGLEAGHHVSASDIPLPEGVRLESDPDMVICRIAVIAEEAEEEEPLEAAEGAEPEIVSDRAAKETEEA